MCCHSLRIEGNKLTLGVTLFERIMGSPQGTAISEHLQEDMWSLLANKDGKVHWPFLSCFKRCITSARPLA